MEAVVIVLFVMSIVSRSSSADAKNSIWYKCVGIYPQIENRITCMYVLYIAAANIVGKVNTQYRCILLSIYIYNLYSVQYLNTTSTLPSLYTVY